MRTTFYQVSSASWRRRLSMAFLALCITLPLACGRPAGVSRENTPAALAGSSVVQSATIEHDGLTRSYLFYTPDPLPAGPLPLVFMLHGGGGTAEGAIDNLTEGRWNELADQHGFMVVYPQGLDNRWNDCRADDTRSSTVNDVDFFRALIAQISDAYTIDPGRIYAAGHSNGGMMAFRLAIELSDQVAAAYSNTGALAAVSECAEPAAPVAIMYLAGTADPLVPFAGGPLTLPGGTDQGTVLSADETVAFWVDALDTATTPVERTVPDTVPGDGSTVTIAIYGQGRSGTEVRYYRVDGGGHGWPAPTQFPPRQQATNGLKNQDMNGVDEAWAFFVAHARRTPVALLPVLH